MVAADGGAVTAITKLDSTLQESTHRYPTFLPDGKHFLFLARRAGAGAGENPTIFAGELGSDRRTPVLEVASNVIYASGHLLYVRGTVLVAQRFNPSALKVEGPAVPLVDDVRMDERFSRGVFAASANGVLVCMTGNNQTRTQLRWFDRTGKWAGDVGEPADYTYGGTPNISPDGKSAVLAIANRDRGTSDVWMVDLASGRRRKLTVDTIDHPFAVWLPGGKSVAVTTQDPGNGGIDAVSIDGTRTRRLVTEDGFLWPQTAWDDVLIYAPETGANNFATDLFSVSISKPDEPQPFLTTKAGESSAQFRPGGRLVAYVSNETGRPDVFVSTFPPSGGRWQVSQKGGAQPRWSRDGRQLFYIDPDNYLVAVDVEESSAGFQMGAAHPLFQFYAGTGFWRYDVAADGRFLATAPLKENLESSVTLITDWTRIVQSR
jgi:Tol biopolymer transport system component